MIGATFRKNIVSNWIESSKEYNLALKLIKELEDSLDDKCRSVLTEEEKKFLELVDQDPHYFKIQNSITEELLKRLNTNDEYKSLVKKYISSDSCINSLGYGSSNLLRKRFRLKSGRTVEAYDVSRFPNLRNHLTVIEVKPQTPYLFTSNSINGIKEFFETYPEFAEEFINKYLLLYEQIFSLDAKITAMLKVFTAPEMTINKLKKFFPELYALKDNKDE